MATKFPCRCRKCRARKTFAQQPTSADVCKCGASDWRLEAHASGLKKPIKVAPEQSVLRTDPTNQKFVGVQINVAEQQCMEQGRVILARINPDYSRTILGELGTEPPVRFDCRANHHG